MLCRALEKSCPARENSICKGPGAGMYLNVFEALQRPNVCNRERGRSEGDELY